MLHININELTGLRRELHQIPETAFEEKKTAARIREFLKAYQPDKIVEGIGGEGLAAIYEGKDAGPTVMLRCELDALPIEEANEMQYRSQHPGKGHKCGHDGHMTIMCGVAQSLASRRPAKGRAILLFQPAEETGEGAAKMLNDEKFAEIEPDYIYALHNLPGYTRGQVVVRKGIFASASRGMIVKLIGKPSHASHPEAGVNPAMAASQIIQCFFSIPPMHTGFHRAALITPIHMRVGQPAFGTSPGDGEVMATLRTYRDEQLQILCNQAVEMTYGIAHGQNLDVEIVYVEDFKSVQNNDQASDLVARLAEKNHLQVHHNEQPFAWSEDFGQFTSKYPGALFGLGSGEHQPQLHNNDYDFPDDIIKPGVQMFRSIVDEHLDDE